MTDSEVEEWEKKVKSALLRRDDSLGNLLNSMTSAMYKGYTVNGKSYSLSSLVFQPWDISMQMRMRKMLIILMVMQMIQRFLLRPIS